MLIKFAQQFYRKIPFQYLSPDKLESSLIRKTLINMALRVAGVVLVSTIVSYFHVMANLERQSKTQLEKYIIERGQRESSIFLLAQDNVKFFIQQLLQELQQPTQTNVNAEFERMYFRWKDGTMRNFPGNRPIKEFDATRYPTLFIGRNVKVNTEQKRLLLTAYKLISFYGPAWSNRFPDIYFMTPENAVVNYWKGTAWSLSAKSNLYIPSEEYFYPADPKHNPERKPTWTGLYFDSAVNIWMVSIIAPVYNEKNRFLGVAGQDIILTDLMKNTIDRKLPGTYNLIFRGDGRLISHPKLMDKIKLKQGKLTITEYNDPHLNRIFKLATHLDNDTNVIDNSQDQEYLAVTKIQGPDWYFVTVYPKSLLSEFAFDTVKFVLFSGPVALIVEILLLFSVLRKQIATPLNDLITATDKISTGNFDIHLDLTRQDEIGRLATSFNIMVSQLNTSFTELEQVNTQLENRVAERTVEVQNALRDLQLTQAQMVQTEKMSALGQMVAGIAHEINNPVNFVHANLSHLEAYAQNLLLLIQSYQNYYPNPPQALQDELDEVDLNFLIEDFTKILHSMKIGTTRIREIIKSLRNFSRHDEAEYKDIDIHEGIENALLILQHRLKSTGVLEEIEVIKEYGNLPLAKCYAGQLNQVFMNILSNAIDALDELRLSQKTPPTIWISTHVIDTDWLRICIADNGIGMSEEVRSRLFDPFFTTKPVGKGTGLGLSISYQIIADKHRGKIWCDSQLGQGTKFSIEIPVSQLVG